MRRSLATLTVLTLMFGALSSTASATVPDNTSEVTTEETPVEETTTKVSASEENTDSEDTKETVLKNDKNSETVSENDENLGIVSETVSGDSANTNETIEESTVRTEGDEIERQIPPLILNDEDAEKELPKSRAVYSLRDDMISRLRSMGAPVNELSINVRSIVCGMSSAIGCASYETIDFASRLANYSSAWKNHAAAHEYAHIVQLRQWSYLNASSTYRNVYGGDVEKLANCMALTKGYPDPRDEYCTSSQKDFANYVWAYKLKPVSTVATATSVNISGEYFSGRTVSANGTRNGSSDRSVSISYTWYVNNTKVGTGKSLYLKADYRGKTVKVVYSVTDNGAKKTTSKSSSFTVAKGAIDRLSGSDRYKTNSIVFQNLYFKSKTKPLFVATGANYADALTVGSAVAKTGGVLLLTNNKPFDSETVKRIKLMSPSAIYIIGGTGAVSNSISTQLKNATGVTVTRLGGSDRYATNMKVAEHFYAGNTTENLLIATGENYPDALSASAAGGTLNAPVILVPGSKNKALSSSTLSTLKKIGATKTYIIGGPAVVGETYVKQLRNAVTGNKVSRLYGSDRYKTNLAVNNFLNKTYPMTSLWIATGQNYPDSLSAVSGAGREGGRLVLSNGKCVSKPVASSWINGSNTTVTRTTLVGGVKVLAAPKDC